MSLDIEIEKDTGIQIYFISEFQITNSKRFHREGSIWSCLGDVCACYSLLATGLRMKPTHGGGQSQENHRELSWHPDGPRAALLGHFLGEQFSPLLYIST